jgi:hypothetical protein
LINFVPPASTVKITATLTNLSFAEDGVTCGEAYSIEKWTDGDWVTVRFKEEYSFLGIGITLDIGDSKIYEPDFEWLAEPLTAARYRITTDVFYGNKSPKDKITVYAEFEIET